MCCSSRAHGWAVKHKRPLSGPLLYFRVDFYYFTSKYKTVQIKLDFGRGCLAHHQIYAAVVESQLRGTLARGAVLPTIAHLARQLRVHPKTVARSYRELERTGHIHPEPVVSSRGGLEWVCDCCDPAP